MTQAAEVEAFRRRLIQAFPPRPFSGDVAGNCLCDECSALRLHLPGRRWDEVSSDFIDFNSGSLPLLLPDALVAFLPAYLMRAMETLDQGSVLAEFTMYFLCPGNEEEGWDLERAAGLVSLLDSEQRKVIGEYLRAILGRNTLRSWHNDAAFGLTRWRPE